MMEIIPAIDVKDGKCVRLRQGREDSGTVYAADPRSEMRYLVHPEGLLA